MKLQVLHCCQDAGVYDYHVCKGDDGKIYQIDLMVDGGLGDIEPNTLIGKTVKISRMHAWVAIGHGVEIEGEE